MLDKMWRRVRRFGLQQHDLPTLVENIATMLQLVALDIDARNTRGIPVLLYVTTTVAVACYFYVFQISIYWYLLVQTDRYNVLNKILFFTFSTTSLIAVAKLIYLQVYRANLKQITAGYLVCDATVDPTSRMGESILATLRTVKRRAVVFWLVIMTNGVGYVIKPLVIPGRHLTDDEQLLLGLEPMFESPNYEIAYIVTSLAVILIVYAQANTSGLLIVLAGYTEAHMKALSEELLDLWDNALTQTLDVGHVTDRNIFQPRNQERNKLINAYIKDHLKDIMRTHAVHKELIKQLEEVFKVAIAVEFILLSIGLVADLLGGIEKTYVAVPFSIAQVFMDCFTGQRLIDASMAFENAVYDCKWENFDASNMKLVLMMLRNSQRPMKLSAGGVASLSYSSLMSVVRSIYSVFTALRSTMV